MRCSILARTLVWPTEHSIRPTQPGSPTKRGKRLGLDSTLQFALEIVTRQIYATIGSLYSKSSGFIADPCDLINQSIDQPNRQTDEKQPLHKVTSGLQSVIWHL